MLPAEVGIDMDLTIVITTYNRADTVERLLLSLSRQTDRDFQVVVAIDGSTDDTEEMLSGLRVRYDLKWVNTHCPGYGLALARNQGILASSGDAVVVVDDDSFPGPAFVAAHKASVMPGVITGGPRFPSDPSAERMRWKMEQLLRLPPCTPQTIKEIRKNWPDVYLIENNICLLRDDWIRLGLFSERVKLYGYIGQEFFGRADYFGLKYQVNPEAAVRHHGELEGDNGLQRARKERQTKISAIVRPSLMTPRHYSAQAEWARARAEGREPPPLPSFYWHVVLTTPWRLLSNLARGAKRKLRKSIGK